MAINEDDLKKQNELLEKQVNLQSELSRLRGEDVSKTRQTMDTLREQASMAQELAEISRIEFTSDQQRLDFYSRQERFLDKKLQSGDVSYEQMQNTKKIMAEIHAAQVQGDEAALKAAQDLLDKEQKKRAEMLASTKAAASLANNMARIVGFDDQAVKLGKSLTNAVKRPQEFAKGFITELTEIAGPSGVLGMIVGNTILLAGGLARQEAAFVAATGITKDFKGEVALLKEEFGELTGALDIFPVITALNQGFIGFKNLNQETRLELERAVITFEKFGISAAQSSDILNELTKRARILPSEAAEALLSIGGLTEDTTLPLNELLDAFQRSQKQLSIFGPKGVKIFATMAKSAEDMGMRVGEATQMFFNMVEGFDTFESAASKVATINAFLGGSFIDTYSMVMATAEGPPAQLKLLRSALENAGITAENFGDNIFQARGLARGFGVSVDNLRGFLSGAVKDEDVFLTTQEKMNKLLVKAIDPMTRLSNSIQDLSAFVATNADNFNTLLSAAVKVVDFLDRKSVV